MKKIGCLVINVGTPNSTETSDVKNYLNEFLMDPQVISIPFIFRWIFVKILIAPRRAPASAEKYKKVWMAEGSPLLVLTRRFASLLEKKLGSIKIEVAMRYGNPTISSACKNLISAGCEKIVIFPQYPQYAFASTFSGEERARKELEELNFKGEVTVVQPFYEDPGYLQSWLDKLIPLKNSHDHVLFSFHGLPLAQLKGKIEGCQGTDECCHRPQACALNCYRAQSIRTVERLAEAMQLPKEKYSYSFQSRLGPVEWIRPYTDQVLAALPKQGVKKLCVVVPSFVTDCLETLEEIAIEGEKTFLSNGGEKFTFVPCLNDDLRWVDAAAVLVEKAAALPASVHEKPILVF
ncbi:MAG: ferrochelatase [Bdellovibrionota bacterium]